jgi:hypothetical protein
LRSGLALLFLLRSGTQEYQVDVVWITLSEQIYLLF